MSLRVAQSKSASSRLRLASGSRMWASKPAEITSRSGRKSRSRGRITLSNAARNSSPPSPGRSGAFRPEDVLRAVAVMHVEIDDGGALGGHLLRVARGDGGVVEQAKSHRAS